MITFYFHRTPLVRGCQDVHRSFSLYNKNFALLFGLLEAKFFVWYLFNKRFWNLALLELCWKGIWAFHIIPIRLQACLIVMPRHLLLSKVAISFVIITLSLLCFLFLSVCLSYTFQLEIPDARLLDGIFDLGAVLLDQQGSSVIALHNRNPIVVSVFDPVGLITHTFTTARLRDRSPFHMRLPCCVFAFRVHVAGAHAFVPPVTQCKCPITWSYQHVLLFKLLICHITDLIKGGEWPWAFLISPIWRES